MWIIRWCIVRSNARRTRISTESAVRGQALAPLHPAAALASHDASLAGLLAIVDSLRAGDVRVRKIAAAALTEMLRSSQTPDWSAV
jgi:hypothetical protein